MVFSPSSGNGYIGYVQIVIMIKGYTGIYLLSMPIRYDGGVIGAYLADAMQSMYGRIRALHNNGTGGICFFSGGEGVLSSVTPSTINHILTSALGSSEVQLSADLVFSNNDYRYAAENRSTSISANVCITY
jgi:hypothetical protein